MTGLNNKELMARELLLFFEVSKNSSFLETWRIKADLYHDNPEKAVVKFIALLEQIADLFPDIPSDFLNDFKNHMQFVPEEEIHSFFHHITEKNNPWTSIKCSGDIQRFLHSVLADMESLPPLRFSHEDIFSMLLGGFRFNDIFGGAHFSSKEEFMEFLRQDAVLHKQSIKE